MSQNISRLLLSSSDLVVNLKAGAKNVLAELKPGQTLTAKVIGDSSQREAVLLVLGQKISVKTFTPLKAGEIIHVKVQSTGGETVLKLMPDTAEGALSSPKTMSLPSRQEPYRLLLDFLNSVESGNGKNKPSDFQTVRLKKLLSTMALKSGTPDKEILTRIVRDGGMAWEHKLRKQFSAGNPPDQNRVKEMIAKDMKALVLESLQVQKNEKDPADGPIRIFSDQLEKLQLFNKQSLEETGKLFFPFPIALEGEWRLGQLLIHLSDRDQSPKGRSDRLIRVALVLDLSRLGELSADFSIFDRTVNGFFETADEGVRTLIEEGLPELKARLAAHGFIADHVNCRLAASGDSNGLSLLERVYAEEGLLNLVV